ncbi:MAG: AraC family transcriptional regulator [Massilibacteroides sp.]|nr:AraC family transcriptional regulator [Massilibacteroides sp.]MDD3061944.1 AraC family transcriptional regulator [Massilibacteroides sp.]MDD4115761.1 AraC family transcriptional regulator [Massilibacteroides sp.]MDD4659927.1 AraC family transcriptional regulator [Massilibacteroides sp.]
MNSTRKDQLYYLRINPNDEDWGIVVTTVGYQFIPPKAQYPLSKHPEQYNFKPQNGRTLNEYQLVYITKGSGFFSSQSYEKEEIHAGTMILLLPGEWHSYYPDTETGWDEYWIGFKGLHIDRRVEKLFFTKEKPLYRIGISAKIINLYEDVLRLAAKEKTGHQQMISSILLHILGSVYYKDKNNAFSDPYIVDKINEAQVLMKAQTENPVPPEEIASQLGLGYSWFRRMFKEYTGVSPNQYLIQQKLLRAKELLTTTQLNVSEIAYQLKFDNSGQFSTFFKKREGLTPSEFRERAH